MKKLITLILLFASMPAITQAREVPLTKLYPELSAIARIEILKENTSLHPLSQLERHLYQNSGKPVPLKPNLWVKRDDMSFGPLGGNKARKLEFILGKALKRKATTIVTSGMWGSNHALATAAAAHQMGLKSRLLLGPQPVTKNVQTKLLALKALGAEINFYGSKLTMALGMAKNYLASKFNRKLLYVRPGGTNREGTMGYVNGFLELLEQTGKKGLPSEIIVPVGTAGTAAGLLVGSCLGGVYEKTRIIGIGITHGVLSNGKLVRRTAKKVYKYMRGHLSKDSKKKFPRCNFNSKKAFTYIKEYTAPGYGSAKPEVFEGMKLLKRTQGLTLDSTYSGKAFRYYLDRVEEHIKKEEKLPKMLFWLTYNSHGLDKVIESYPWTEPERKWRDLPKKFWQLYK